MSFNPYLVAGTGRCGSSFVADVLHNDLNVFMGERFQLPDFANEDGYWEDLDFQEINTLLLNSKITFLEWVDKAQRLFVDRNAKHQRWGFKDPRLSELLGSYFMFCDYPRIIYVTRNKYLFIRSQKTRYKNLTWTDEDLSSLYENRMLTLSRFLNGRDYLQIHFDERRKTREEVAEVITAKWPELAQKT